MACSSSDWLQRLVLVLSNVAFLFPWAYIVVSKHLRKFVWLEASTILWTMFWSLCYHLCDAASTCNQYCILQPPVLHNLDFIFSYQLLTTLPLVGWNQVMIKHLMATLTFLVHIYKIQGLGLSSSEEWKYQLTWIALYILPLAVYRLEWKQIKTFICSKYGRLSTIFALLAVICKALGTFDYWILHSLWHVLMAMSLYFALKQV